MTKMRQSCYETEWNYTYIIITFIIKVVQRSESGGYRNNEMEWDWNALILARLKRIGVNDDIFCYNVLNNISEDKLQKHEDTRKHTRDVCEGLRGEARPPAKLHEKAELANKNKAARVRMFTLIQLQLLTSRGSLQNLIKSVPPPPRREFVSPNREPFVLLLGLPSPLDEISSHSISSSTNGESATSDITIRLIQGTHCHKGDFIAWKGHHHVGEQLMSHRQTFTYWAHTLKYFHSPK